MNFGLLGIVLGIVVSFYFEVEDVFDVEVYVDVVVIGIL